MADLSILSRTNRAPESTTTIPAPAWRWKTRILLPGLILATLSVLLAYAARDALWPATAVRVVPVVVKTASQTSGGIAFQAAGWVEADPFPIAVSALTDGVVKEVLVLEGQAVQAGQIVARLVDEDARLALAQADAQLAERQAELAAAQAALTGVQREWDNPVERRRAVAVGEALLVEARAELIKLDSDLAAAVAKTDELREELKRKSEALASRATSEFDVIQTRLRLQSQEAITQSTRAQKPVLQAKAQRLEEELAAAKEHLRLRIAESTALETAKATLAKAQATLLQAQAARDEAQLRLNRVEVRSPADGIVLARLTEPGAKLMLNSDAPHSAQALRLYDPKRLQVRVDVPLADAARISVGQEAQLVVDVLPDRTFKGRITRVVHEADIQKNTLQVKVALEDPAAEIKPEMLARARFLSPARVTSGSTQQRIFAPQRLLQTEAPDRAQAWVLDPAHNTAVPRSLKLGLTRQDGWLEVLEGLHPGDRLISADPATLRPGQKLNVIGEDSIQ